MGTEEGATDDRMVAAILTPDQRVRVFVSSTMEELAGERVAVRDAVSRMHLSPVLFELGARAHPPRSLYRSYLEQSHVFVGIYWERYGWVAPTMDVSGLEDEYLLAGSRPKLMYIKRPAPGREPRLGELLDRIRSDDDVAYKSFGDADELERLVLDDLSLLLSEAFLVAPAEAAGPAARGAGCRARRRRSWGGRPSSTSCASRCRGSRPGCYPHRARRHRQDPARAAGRGPARRASNEGAASWRCGTISEARRVVGRRVGDRSARQQRLHRRQLEARSRRPLPAPRRRQLRAGDGCVRRARRAPGAAPGLKVLVTSREALRIQAEYEFPVPPLGIDDSVEMFAARAVAVRPDFHVTEENRAVFERICERLEGVPLAIELAAARTKLLSPEALLSRLDKRLDFLVSGPRDLPERQRALSTTIEWSYDLLDEWDQRLLRRLGVFVGSFPLAAVEAISPDSAEDGRDALDVLASLVDKSLLQVEATAGDPRFRMLGMIADFARERLAATDDVAVVGERHAVYFRDLSVAIGHGVMREHQKHWLEVLGDDEQGEAGNIRAALAWFVGHGRLDDLAEMAWALWVPAWINGRIEEGKLLAGAALEAPGDMTDRSRARLTVVLGLFRMWSGEHPTAAESLAEGLERARVLGDEEVEAAAILGQSMIVAPVDGESQAEELAAQALELYDRLGDPWGEAAALNVLGWLYVAQERFDATDVLERTLSTSIAAGDEQFTAMAEVNLAEARLHDGDVPGATTLLRSCVDRHRATRLPYSVAYVLDAVARVAGRDGDPARAARLTAAADGLPRRGRSLGLGQPAHAPRAPRRGAAGRAGRCRVRRGGRERYPAELHRRPGRSRVGPLTPAPRGCAHLPHPSCSRPFGGARPTRRWRRNGWIRPIA